MIALLEGTIVEHIDDQVIITCGGVGYGALVTSEDYGRLPVGKSARLYIYEHIREQSHDLFGFIDISSKELFEILLSVNGVGPKMALAIMSVAPSTEVRKAIAEGNMALLKAANGVGKRVAERIIVDLKEKVGYVSSDEGAYNGLNTLVSDEAVDALISLGYTTLDAQRALVGIDTSLTTEERIKLALQQGSHR
ncbi:MAG TPA: Holliday junction branch migration protein RuvA [Candidatus Saccharibacteria bacterium]|nr:Holliday junction branch migration protein RuvA [Candidatus Saccharibacteria bacterium]MCB9817620.1 Holliday junction branch migration protein RuvA [Candidatus Nomurabacteria bacterium]HPR09984.1 Holliday junction branch migration protein RuvA [Candidatus Saccharibacteria bacterium]